MNAIAQFTQDQIEGAIAEFVPGQTVTIGKTVTERRLSVLSEGSTAVKLFAVNQTGKVGKAAREGLAGHGVSSIIKAAAHSNYKPLSEALALVMGESCFITNRASYESLKDRFLGKESELIAMGKAYRVVQDKKSGTAVEKMTSKYSQIMQALSLIQAVHDGVEAIRAHAE